jgi:hypothetical protein
VSKAKTWAQQRAKYIRSKRCAVCGKPAKIAMPVIRSEDNLVCVAMAEYERRLAAALASTNN